MQRICFFVGDMSRNGGTEHMVQLLANELAISSNYQVYVLSKQTKKNSQPFFALDSSIIYRVLDTEKYKGIRSILREIGLLQKFVIENKIDVLINADTSLGIESLPLKLLYSSLKQIYWDHFCSDCDNGSKWAKWLSRTRIFALRLGNAYVVITPEDSIAMKQLVRKPCPVICIENICAYPKMDNSYNSVSKTIISVGSIIKIKGFDYALQVAQIVFRRHKDWNWKIYGDGADIDALQEKTVKLGLENNVSFMGATKQLDVAYKDASIFVMTSRQESFGLVLIEAQSFHLPTVAFDVPNGPRNIIRDNVNGFLCSPFDINEMADRICELIEDSTMRQSFSDNACCDSEKYSPEKVGQKWKNLLESV